MKIIHFEIGGKRHEMATLEDDDQSAICTKLIIENTCYPKIPWNEPPQIIVDLGGHTGEFSVINRIYFPDAEIHCYEPNPQLLECLDYNATRYGFHIHPVAVHPSQGGKGKLIGSEYGPVAYSLYKTARQTDEIIEVNLIPAASVVHKSNILKVDIEGREPEVIAEMDYQRIEVIYVEFHSMEDRIKLEKLLLPTHDLCQALINHRRQGELTYIRRNSIREQ